MTDRLPEGTEDLQFRDLQTMLAVAEAGSFRKASQSLQVGQSAITRRVQKLENALGVSLFERRATGARLTVAGWSFVKPVIGYNTFGHRRHEGRNGLDFC